MNWAPPTDIALEDVAREPGSGRSESLADIIEWLFLVFEERLGLTTVLEAVHQCCRELDIDADATALDRLERVAFERLTALAAARGVAATSPEPIRLPPRLGPREQRAPQLV